MLIVGGGARAARRCAAMTGAGGRVRVAAETLSEAFEDCRDFEHLARPFEPGDLDGARLVFVASDDDALAERVAVLAGERGIPVNVADRRRLCSFIMPSIVNRSPLVVAVSSGAPAGNHRGQPPSSAGPRMGRPSTRSAGKEVVTGPPGKR